MSDASETSPSRSEAASADLPQADAISSPEALSREILQGLLEGRFVPGQKLAERDLMESYGLGRSTVREGLGRLAASGVVELVPHRGAMIRRLTAREATDVVRVAGALLGLAARQAAEAVRGGADGEPLAQAAAAYDGATGPARAGARARYYRQLTQLAGNHELTRLLPTIQIPLVRAQLGLRGLVAGGSHAEMIAAILAADTEAAERAAGAHMAPLMAEVSALSARKNLRG